MIRFWICLALAISGSVICYDFEGDEGWYDDYNYYDDVLEGKKQIGSSNIPTIDEESNVSGTSPAVATESLGNEQQDVEEDRNDDTRPNFDTANDYQFEDNRSELGDNFEDDSKTTRNDRIYIDDNFELDLNNSTETGEYRDVVTTVVHQNDNEDKDPIETSTQAKETYDELAYLNNDSERKVLEETKSILMQDTGNDFAEIKPDEENKTNLAGIIKETNNLLDDTPDSLDEDDDQNVGQEISSDSESIEDTSKSIEKDSEEEDTVDKALNDLMSDLDKLHETWNKLQEYDDDSEQDVEIGENVSFDKGKFSDEDTDYEAIDDTNLEEIFQSSEGNSEEKTIEENVESNSSSEKQVVNRMSKPILYLNDALMASEAENGTDSASSASTAENTSEPTMPSVSTTEAEVEIEQTTANVEDLSSAEVAALMEDFTKDHNIKEISAADVRNAINIRLTVNEPVVITTPNYPAPYPSNNVIDWMFTGDGMGIELNITDFAVNGFAGDYLLVKPGGVDESGSTGLLFSYSLTSERRYRFLDVDRMFVRFQANPAMSFMRGFSFSTRMVVPRPGAPPPEPEPAPILPPIPSATITLNLAGVPLEKFVGIEEQFRVIIADMATMYINMNNIDPGINSTLEITQITSKGLCFHNWPKFELCTEVRFGIPLVYDNEDGEERKPRLNEEDLMDMWETLSQRDPFAVRLRMLGITEYQVPNDRGVLTVWLVIAGGVVISMAMLAFALWRFSCFADYTRMPSFSDTDSINEKRKLDLYPTPHQTLPPLFSETDYKWADAKYDDSTKVHVGGFSNKSFINNDLFDVDSDEDALPSRHNRSSGISPRDIYSV